jgi:hypothetical protein
MTGYDYSALGLLELLKGYEAVLLAGSGRGAGKTTVLKSLVDAAYKLGEPEPLAVTGIGRGSDFPEVSLYPGMLAATAAGCLPGCGFTREILNMTGYMTALGEVVVMRALSGGRVRLAGPTTNSSLEGLRRYLIEDCGASQVIVDGSGERKTFIGTGNDSAVVLCAGADDKSFDMEKTILDIAHQCRIMSLPVPALPPEEGGVFIEINGAVTAEAVEAALESRESGDKTADILASDPGKIFLRRRDFEKLKERGYELYVRKPVLLAAVALNPGPFDPGDFLRGVRDAADVPVFDVVNYGSI